MIRWMLIAALAAPLPAIAQDGTPPSRIRNIQLKQGEQCPKAEGDEIVVCGQLDADEVYRIPKQFREPPPSPANTAWAVRSEQMMEDNRAGLPDSCSPVGTGGQTGCNAQLLRNYRVQKREQRIADQGVP